MTKQAFKIIYAIVIIAIVTSCEDDLDSVRPETANQLSESGTADISLTDEGMLNFKSSEVFQKTIMEIKDLEPEAAVKWSNQFQLKSLFAIYQDALNAEKEFEIRNAEFITSMKKIENEAEAAKFRETYHNQLKVFEQQIAFNQQKFGDYVIYENGRVQGIKTYDPIMSRITNKHGLVMVAGTVLQYTQSQLKVMTTANKGTVLQNASVNNAELGISIKELAATEGKFMSRTEEEQLHTQHCQDQFSSDRKMTGNSAVRNTVVPRYRQVWVPRVCEVVCDFDDPVPPAGGGPVGIPFPTDPGCFDSCTGGYYRDVFEGYEVINTRLEATIRNYKIVCLIGCWDLWDGRVSRLNISGVFSANEHLNRVEKFGWIRDIAPQATGTFNVAYESDFSLLLNGRCFTSITW